MYQGPKALPFLGNSLEFASNSEGIYNAIMKFSKQYDRFFRIWLGNDPFLVCYNYKEVETVLSSTSHIVKANVYRFIIPWIGYGLLTSKGQKWKTHRRIITPTFHFKILEEFIDVFNSNGEILCNKLLKERSGKGPFDVYKYINLYALDNICETAMGMKMDAQINSESTFVKAIKDMCTVVNLRAFKIWLMTDFLLNLTKYGAMQKKALAILHGTTNEVIKRRREELKNKKSKTDLTPKTDDDENLYQKRRLAFLDLLLESAEGAALSDEDIREEVDTFMFEGHDTVTSGISFVIYALAYNPEVQERAYKEQLEIFGDSDRSPTSKDINEMKYLERVLKESQRLYPSVPLIARYIHEDLPLSDGYVMPKGTQCTLLITALHKDPKVWPNPDKFDPDNFLPDAAANRSPYAYVPFSAGPRNCIGQRFAMLEMKCCISKIIRKFKLSPSPNPEDEARIVAELVLISANGINVQVEARN